MTDPQDRSIDPATIDMLSHACEQGVELAWDRQEEMGPQCGFGNLGLCCRICTVGPCRIDPLGNGPKEGICGADAHVIAARNLMRMIAGGAASHSDHGRHTAHTLPPAKAAITSVGGQIAQNVLAIGQR